MNRRGVLRILGTAFAVLPVVWSRLFGPVKAEAAASSATRVRPNESAWPSEQDWETLNKQVSGRLIKVESPLAVCAKAPTDPNCAKVFKALKNPYYLGDEPGLTQTLGWVGAWISEPSVCAVAVESTDDVVAAVNFAREHNLRLVVKGGGHSYYGTSNAADSLLIWTRKMNSVTLQPAFVGVGCAGSQSAVPAVTVGAGAIWGHVYNQVSVKSGSYVQGGGCMTVGVAGLIQGGGFGSFSKAFGMAAGSLLEAEIVTADGTVRIANVCTNPDLFWAIKGGSGGSLGVLTRLTLRTHTLPETFGVVLLAVTASSESAFERLTSKVLAFYAEALFNPHWGEQISFRPGNALVITMLFQGLSKEQAEKIWEPFLAWVRESPQDFSFDLEPKFLAGPARHFWDPEFLRKVPQLVLADDRPGASPDNVFWAGNLGEAGQVLYAYQSAWIPDSFLQPDRQAELTKVLLAAAKHWRTTLHTNKGLAGATPEAIAAAKETAMNPAVLDAFALIIVAAEGPPGYPGIPGHEPDTAIARKYADAVEQAMNEIRKIVPNAGSYFLEGNFFDQNWQESFWGPNYPKLLAIKDKYDPDGLFFSHHGLGSERWSADGFTRVS
ncbi:MAG: FAD-binding oxidoreductase [Verrucomicrobia bacterium]|nr:FAD-binding oxidoreductase [Verrucomicrobiota bacterium]